MPGSQAVETVAGGLRAGSGLALFLVAKSGSLNGAQVSIEAS